MSKLATKELSRALAKAGGVTAAEGRVLLKTLLETLGDVLAREDNDLEIRRFGTFRVRTISGKVGRRMKTGETIALKPYRKVHFKPGVILAARNIPREEGR